MQIKYVAALLLTASSAFAQTLPAGVAKGPSVEGITEYRLPSPTWSARAMRTMARPAWRTCWST
jgi:hypothetical protein